MTNYHRQIVVIVLMLVQYLAVAYIILTLFSSHVEAVAPYTWPRLVLGAGIGLSLYFYGKLSASVARQFRRRYPLHRD